MEVINYLNPIIFVIEDHENSRKLMIHSAEWRAFWEDSPNYKSCFFAVNSA